MSADRWAVVDAYLTDTLLPADPVLDDILAESAAAGLPDIQVSAPQGALLHLLARLQGARTILEVGTLGGYSTIWLARALPDGGRLVTLESEVRHAEVARANVDRAGLGDIVDVRVGPAMDLLPSLATDPATPFDLVFIDADKPNNPHYFAWARQLTRPGSLIIVDNVVRDGAVADSDSDDAGVQGTRQLLASIGSDPAVTGTAIQTVGVKGYDGFAIVVVSS
ncbi:MAG: O-methyltransferase [Nocardioidaceae bacterium]|nr:O-methyltransferase [Nocardioidaceae bacterium]